MSWSIQIENLGKAYNAGASRRLSNSFAESMMQGVRSALRGGIDGWESFWALKDISLEVAEGEILGIMGRNGAGKSTLLKILSRITLPTEGIFRYRGRLASLLEIGTGFHGQLTGRENVFLNGSILGLTRAEIRGKFDEIVAFAGVESFLDTPVKYYSSGMYMRLAFAVAAHLETDILLVDEVLAVGDAEFHRKCLGRMDEVSRSGRSVVVVSHSSSTIKSLCSRAVLLDQGKLTKVGDVDAVIGEYMNVNKVGRCEREIDESEQMGGRERMRIKRVRLLNGFKERFSVFWKQDIQIAVEIEFMQSFNEVAVGCGIRTVEGLHVFTVHHDDGGDHPLWNVEAGRYLFRFTLRNNLRPGTYQVHIGADQQHLMIKHLGAVENILLEVMDHAQDGPTPLASQTGLVNGSSIWEKPQRI